MKAFTLDDIPKQVQLRRKGVFRPCETQEELLQWCRVYMGIRIPTETVSEESNSSPGKLLWEVYDRCIRNDLEGFEKVMAFASRFSGKCVKKGTWIKTRTGLKKIEDIKIDDEIWSGWAYRPVANWIHDGVKDGVELELEYGRRLTGSTRHRVWAWSAGELPTWKYLTELTPTDLVATDVSELSIGDVQNEDDYELGYLLGILQGDGCLRLMESQGTVTFTTAKPALLEVWNDWCLRLAGKLPRQSKSRPYDYIVCSRKMCDQLAVWGLTPSYSFEKTIPDFVMKSRDRSMGFVAGLLDTDGTVSKGGNARFDLTAQTLVEQLQVLLASLGVDSQLVRRFHLIGGQKHPVWKLGLSTVESYKLKDLRIRTNKLERLRHATFTQTGIPKTHLTELLSRLDTKGGRWKPKKTRKPATSYKTISLPKIRALLEHGESSGDLTVSNVLGWNEILSFNWQAVAKTTRVQADFYDLTVDGDHSYWSDGFVSHNTLIASILEVLVVLHMPRNVAHMAAIENQAKKAQQYVKDFFGRPVLRDFVYGDNAREVKVVCWIHKPTGIPVSDREFNKMAIAEQQNFYRREQYIKIVICNMAGANGDHVEWMCMDGDTLVPVRYGKDGRVRKQKTIRGIVRHALGQTSGGRENSFEVQAEVVNPIDVLSFNHSSGVFEFRPVTHVTKKFGPAIKVKTEASEIVVSPDHLLIKSNGQQVEARDLVVGTPLLRLGKIKNLYPRTEPTNTTPTESTIVPEHDEWSQIVLGSLLGDCGVYKKPSNNPYLNENHSPKQKDYLDWKWNIIGRKVRIIPTNPTSGYTGQPLVGYRTGCSPTLLPYVNVRSSLEGVENLGPLGLACWYMDDGVAGNGVRFSTEGFSYEQNRSLAELLERKWNIKVEVKPSKGKYWFLQGGVEAKRRLVEVVRPYIHPSMAYKFDVSANTRKCDVCGDEYWYYQQGNQSRDCGKALCQAVLTTKLSVDPVISVEVCEDRWLYDLTVDNNHNFIGNRLLSHNCMDELDVIPRQNIKAYDQAKGGIPVGRDGCTAFSLYTSTRKSRVGLVQQEIERADSSGLVLRHWNIIDVTAPCPPSKHIPDAPRQYYYINDTDVRHISPEEYEILPVPEQPKWIKTEGYAGCAKCRLFPACKGLLATKQKGYVAPFAEGGTALLVKVAEAESKFRGNTPEFITTEFLCRKPDTSGMVFPRLREDLHFKSAVDIAKMVSGEDLPLAMLANIKDKPSIIKHLHDIGARFYTGMDFGFSHIFAVMTIAVWGQNAFVVDAIGQSGLEMDDKIDICQHLKQWKPTIFGDTENPEAITTFKRKGFKMAEWSKKGGSVEAGIEVIRTKLWSNTYGATLFFLEGDPVIAAAFKTLKDYKFTTDATGNFTNTPEKVGDDFADALRYAIMNVFARKGAMKADSAPIENHVELPNHHLLVRQQEGAWMSNHIRQLTGEDFGETDSSQKVIKKGGFFWDV